MAPKDCEECAFIIKFLKVTVYWIVIIDPLKMVTDV